MLHFYNEIIKSLDLPFHNISKFLFFFNCKIYQFFYMNTLYQHCLFSKYFNNNLIIPKKKKFKSFFLNSLVNLKVYDLLLKLLEQNSYLICFLNFSIFYDYFG